MSVDKKQKIALAVSSFAGGGAERVIVTLANKFIERGYPVDLIVVKNEGPYKKLLNDNVKKIVLVKENKGRVRNRLLAFKVLYGYLKSNEIQTIMSTLKELNVFIGITVLISRVSVKHTVREADTLDRIFVTGGFKNKFLLYFMRFYYKKAYNVIANCKVTKNDLVEHVGLKSVDVFYNPLDLKYIREMAGKRSNSKQIKLVACGRLDQKKNFPDLIKTIPILQQKFPSITLEILGQGVEKEALVALINKLNLTESVKLLGFVDNPYKYYASADVFVQTSLWEGFGYVLAEAMACGTPVVAYDSKGAMREILADGKYGILTPVGDLQALADGIISQIENPTPRDVLQEAVKRFDVDLIAEQYLSGLGVK